MKVTEISGWWTYTETHESLHKANNLVHEKKSKSVITEIFISEIVINYSLESK